MPPHKGITRFGVYHTPRVRGHRHAICKITTDDTTSLVLSTGLSVWRCLERGRCANRDIASGIEKIVRTDHSDVLVDNTLSLYVSLRQIVP